MAAVRTFSRTKQAWYAQYPLNNGLYDNEEVMITVEDEASSIFGEFSIKWDKEHPEAELHFYSDTWALLPYLSDVFSALSKLDGQPSVDDVCQSLKDVGLKDTTPRKGPKAAEMLIKAHRTPTP